ncbi:membrane glycosyltransferase [Rhizomicrobium palustre]|uniref:Glucans biosynthesis glucosyltransferase H n=1 Tax=Rhizomicrobium palustre TaxID=189966 RepID=A0A846N1Y5_9PROT|nr:membrane glycosyltransferase [Rhizomicrobium palustre]
MKKPEATLLTLRWLFLGLVLATTAAGMSRLWNLLRIDGMSLLEGLYLVLVAILFTWISASFWLAALGAYASWRGIADSTLRWPDRRSMTTPPRARTALLCPVRNEETRRIVAGIETIAASIREAGEGDYFDFFILSDSNDPERILAETMSWQDMQEGDGPHIYYRHREDNSGKKAGNIAEFCRNWGAHYDYMVVLDADSLMTGETLASLVALMEENPRAALIQVAPQLVGRDSLFARIQQFSSSVYGPLYATGLSLLQGPGGNYWGHNAIIRIQPFMEHCGLPELKGRAPLGGEILSHDFVEAALLRRAGWRLHLVTELTGSYEEPPPTLIDHLIRDRRWCQGNLQHMQLIFGQGFTTESRGHFLNGVMSYLSSPLWFAMLIVSVFVIVDQPDIAPVTYVGRYPVLALGTSHVFDFVALVAAMVLLLYGPKLFALALLLKDREARKAHGGGIRASLSVLLEAIFSTLLAPISMLSQSAFVVRILMGETQGWGAQFRDERRVRTLTIARAFWVHTLIGLCAGAAIYVFLPGTIWWFTPLLVGPILSIPLVRLTSSVNAGIAARRLGLFLSPSETGRIPIAEALRARLEAPAALGQLQK